MATKKSLAKRLRNLLKINTIRYQLYQIVLGLLLIISIYAGLGFGQMQLSQWKSDAIKTWYLPFQQHLNGIKNCIEQLQNQAAARIYTPTNEDLKINRTALYSLEQIVKTDLAYEKEALQTLASSSLVSPALIDKVTEFQKNLEPLATFPATVGQLTQKYKTRYLLDAQTGNGKDELTGFFYNENLDSYLKNEFQPRKIQWLAEIKAIEKEADRMLGRYTQDLESIAQVLALLRWSLVLLGVLGLLWLLRRLYRQIKKDIEYTENYIATLAQGDFPKAMPEFDQQEFRPLSEQLLNLREELGELQAFALSFQKGHFTKEITFFNEQGALGSAFAQMRQELQETSQESDIRNWKNAGLALFGEILRDNAADLELLAQKITVEFINYLKVNQVGFYLVEQAHTPEAHLKLAASFAYNKPKALEAHIEWGQGLIGQAWKEGESAYLTELPQGYTYITSGLGEATPSALFLVALKHNHQVQGVIELASLQPIPEYKRTFVEEVAADIASTIATAKSSLQTMELLQETQVLATTLQKQDEEVKLRMQELSETQQQMQTAQTALSAKEANLQALINNTSHAILAFDKDYNITVINRTLRKLYLGNNIVLKPGQNLLKDLPELELAKRQQAFTKVLNGEKFERIEESERFGQTIYLQSFYNPIRNEANEVMGASVFMEDITQRRATEHALKQTQFSLESLINDTDDWIWAVDAQYKLLVFNQSFENEMSQRGSLAYAGADIFSFFFQDEDKAVWRKHLDEALAENERFVRIVEQIEPDMAKLYFETWFNPIRNEQNQGVGVSVFMRNITQAKQQEVKTKQMLLDSLVATDDAVKREAYLQTRVEQLEKKIQLLEQRINLQSQS